MTDHPHTIGSEQSISEAARRMQEHRIRHLPVLEGGALVGMISDRDVLLGERVSPPLTVADVMSPETFAVSPDARVSAVVAKMAEQRLGSAVVMQGTKVIGIFTTTDALQMLARALGEGG
jgi:acetoin utilization protein AcuB